MHEDEEDVATVIVCCTLFLPVHLLILGFECNRENEASLAVLPDLLVELDSMTEVCLIMILTFFLSPFFFSQLEPRVNLTVMTEILCCHSSMIMLIHLVTVSIT